MSQTHWGSILVPKWRDFALYGNPVDQIVHINQNLLVFSEESVVFLTLCVF